MNWFFFLFRRSACPVINSWRSWFWNGSRPKADSWSQVFHRTSHLLVMCLNATLRPVVRLCVMFSRAWNVSINYWRDPNCTFKEGFIYFRIYFRLSTRLFLYATRPFEEQKRHILILIFPQFWNFFFFFLLFFPPPEACVVL